VGVVTAHGDKEPQTAPARGGAVVRAPASLAAVEGLALS
jgi:hypothetical protein